MRAFPVIIAASCALAACASNNEMAETAPPMAPAADPNNPLMAPGYMAMAASSDQFEIQSGQLALQASQNPAVQSFARMLIAQHQATTTSVMQAAQSAGMTPPPPILMPQHQQMLDQLRAAGSGPAFDQAFRDMQISAHQQALELHQNYASGGDVPALRQAAASAVPIVQQHLTTAQSLDVAMQPPPSSTTAPVRSGERG